MYGHALAVASYIAPEIVVPVETAPLTRGHIATYFETTSRVEAERQVDVAISNSFGFGGHNVSLALSSFRP